MYDSEKRARVIVDRTYYSGWGKSDFFCIRCFDCHDPLKLRALATERTVTRAPTTDDGTIALIAKKHDFVIGKKRHVARGRVSFFLDGKFFSCAQQTASGGGIFGPIEQLYFFRELAQKAGSITRRILGSPFTSQPVRWWSPSVNEASTVMIPSN